MSSITSTIVTTIDTSDPDLKAVWDALPPSMHEAYLKHPPPTRIALCKSLLACHGGLDGVCAYFEHFQCPIQGVPCSKIEFDNIKIFYHPTYPDSCRHVSPTWNFYIARPGAGPQDCIDWKEADIKITGLLPNGEWVDFMGLTCQPRTVVCIDYPYGSSRSVRIVVFPWRSNTIPPDVPIHQLT